VATATALTARSISSAYKAFVLSHTPLHRTIISGGGARNATLMKMIASEVDGEVLSSTDLGVLDIDREAMAFALMAHASMMGESSNLPAVTGAKKPLVLGTVTMDQL